MKKTIVIDGIRNVKSFKEDKKREIFKSNNIDKKLLKPHYQTDVVAKLYSDIDFSCNKFVSREIQKKINGYKQQDREKNHICDTITYDEVLMKMLESKLICVYCNKQTYILYERVREPSQWTLDRIDNSTGHTNENTQICCLHCNLQRKTLIHEKFLFTKKMIITKED
jgi:hypothetical protein